jgi:2-polyprenyl-3-methyl-5-hydroxy-6-metoxy-1,4-benzoquinol methylase
MAAGWIFAGLSALGWSVRWRQYTMPGAIGGWHGGLTMSTYVFDPSWQQERDRLRALESLFDGFTTRQLADLGVGEGWRCLEVGAGAGSIARWLADRVGGSGRVLAIDLDLRFLQDHGRDNLEARKLNIMTEALDDGGFDLVHSRALLGHLPDRSQAMERMALAVRPEGWLVQEDVDFKGIAAAALAHYVDPPEHAELFERVLHGVGGLFGAAGADAAIGARLIRAFKDAGLENIAAEAHVPIVAGGTETWARGTIEFLAEPLVRTGLVSAEDVERALAMTADPAVHYPPPFIVSAWGQRPAAAE